MSTFIPRGGAMARVMVSLSTAVMLSGAGVVMPLVASADHTAIHTLEQQITALMDQLNALKAQQAGPTGKCAFTRSLSQGVSGDDVKCLQQYLNSSGNQVAASGAGSPGNETVFFGSLTRAAVSKWQAANGVSPTAGYFGPISQAKYNSLVAAAPPPAPTPTPTPPGAPPPAPPPGTGLAVAAAIQPGDSLAPLNAARIPATKFMLTASSDGDIIVNSITVERQGPSSDSSINKVQLLDEDGLQIGLDKTLNSNHQAVLNEKITVKAGKSQTITVAFTRPATGSDGGDIARFAVIAVDAGASTVSGTLPIVGSSITLNSTLSVGSLTMSKGVNDPGASQTKEIGTKGYIFTALRLTAGSNEDVNVKSIRFNQSGSAARTDLANLVMNFDGTDYPATISSDGKYYTAKLGDAGVAITKGNTKEVYVKGDVQDGTNRGVDFDLYRLTDINVAGKQFGYGITPAVTSDQNDSQTDDDGTFDDDVNPVWDAYEATIGAGTLTVTKSTQVAAQNIAINLNDQPLGAFQVDVKGEPIQVASMVFRVSANRNDSSVSEADYTDVKLVDLATGKVVAGPKDGSGTTDTQMVFTFTDSVTFPTGIKHYVMRGKLSTDFDSDTLVSASTTPNTDWTSVTGEVSGTSITPANTGDVSGASMTVKAGAVNVSLASTPQTQTVIRGAKAFTLAKLVFDATASGEDIRFTSAQVQLDAARAADVTTCQLYDGTTALNTGTNIQNPLTTGDKTFTLDTHLTIPKGTSKDVALKCDISSSGTGAYAQWTFSSNETFGATGLTSGTSITPAVASSSVTNLMTFAGTGTLTVTLDPSSPSVQLVRSGQEVTVAVLRFRTENEGMDVKQVALQLSNTASNTPADLVKLSLWDGATKLGEVSATSSDSGMIVTTNGFSVGKDTERIVSVKAELAAIGTNEAGRPGHLVTVNWDQVNQGGNSVTYAVGEQSSNTVYASGSDTASAGVRMVRAYPTISVLSVPSTSLADATQKVLHRFSVASPAGTNGLALYKFTFNIATTGDDGASIVDDLFIRSLRLFAYVNSNFSGGRYTADGQLNNGTLLATSDGGNDGIESDRATTTDYAIYFNPADPTDTAATAPEAIAMSAGETLYFELRGDVSGADSGDTATVQLMGDRAWTASPCGGGGSTCDDGGFLAGSIAYAFATTAPFTDEGQGGIVNAKNIGATTGGNNDDPGVGDDFIWSGNSTTTHSGEAGKTGPDWYNGFVVPGLPASGATAVTFSL